MNSSKTILKSLIVIFLCFFVFYSQALGQLRTEVVNGDTLTIYKYETKGKIDIETSIDLKKSKDLYHYQYSVISKLTSGQEVYTFEVYLDSPHEGLNSPSGWFGLDSGSKPTITWASRDSIYRIRPGGQKNGFVISSNGLPSISSYLAKGWTEIPVFEIEPDSFENASVSEDSKKGFTVGPGISPEEIEPISHVDTLQYFVSRSCTELSWITSQGLCRSLKAKLENVKRQLDRGNTRGATGSLQAFLNEVQAQKGKQLSSEAYALLYFNGQYLLEQLNQ